MGFKEKLGWLRRARLGRVAGIVSPRHRLFFSGSTPAKTRTTGNYDHDTGIDLRSGHGPLRILNKLAVIQ